MGTVAMKLDADLTSANSDIKFKHSRCATCSSIRPLRPGLF